MPVAAHARHRGSCFRRRPAPTCANNNLLRRQEICDGICFSASSPFARPCCSVAPILLYYHLRSHLPPGIVLISAVSRIHPVCLVRNRKRDRWVILNPAPLTFFSQHSVSPASSVSPPREAAQIENNYTERFDFFRTFGRGWRVGVRSLWC